jgi:hypothetical protein
MKFHPRIAPIKVAVFPLLKNKPELVIKPKKSVSYCVLTCLSFTMRPAQLDAGTGARTKPEHHSV